MKKTFLETPGFTNWVVENLDDEEYAAFQLFLMAHPNAGDVIPGCGGLRKVRIRIPRRQKGKRGGARVIYLHVPEADWIFLVDVYEKGEKSDLTATERKQWRQLAQHFRTQAMQAVARASEEQEQ